MTTRTVRDKFARLSQMATLLTLEAVGGAAAAPAGCCTGRASHPCMVCGGAPFAHAGRSVPPWAQVSEVLDYWGDAGAIAWRLTDNDVRQILSQRLDFAPQEILALKL